MSYLETIRQMQNASTSVSADPTEVMTPRTPMVDYETNKTNELTTSATQDDAHARNETNEVYELTPGERLVWEASTSGGPKVETALALGELREWSELYLTPAERLPAGRETHRRFIAVAEPHNLSRYVRASQRALDWTSR